MARISIFRDGRHLAHKSFIKPTARHLPLGPDSRHAPAIHESWPVAEMARMTNRSARPTDAVMFRDIKISRFAECFLPECVLKSCRSYVPRFPIQCGPTAPRKIFVVVPWHPSHARELKRRIHEINERWARAMLVTFKTEIKISIVWSNAGRPIFSKLRNAITAGVA